MPEPTIETAAVASYVDGIRRRADTLRRLADDIDREADRALTVHTSNHMGADFSNNFAWSASQVQNHVLSALPNLRLGLLTTDAAQIDELFSHDK